MWLIIGYGNPLRGDDGAGPLLAKKLAKHLPSAQAKVIVIHQLTPELALDIAAPEIRQVLFIDVKRDQLPPVRITPLQADSTDSCGHQVSPKLLLQIATQLFNCSIAGWLLTLSGKDFSFNEQLSPSTTAAIDKALKLSPSFLDQPTAFSSPILNT